MHHSLDPICTLCEWKKKDAHPEIQYYWDVVKKKFPDAHLSCTWRSESEQNYAYSQGASRLEWPYSLHNQMKDKKPYARAMDIFQIREDKVPAWQKDYFKQIYDFLLIINAPITWGGTWESLKDYPHFQLKPEVK